MSKKLKKRLGRILLGAAAFAAAIALEQLLLQSDIWILVPYLIAYIIIGGCGKESCNEHFQRTDF